MNGRGNVDDEQAMPHCPGRIGTGDNLAKTPLTRRGYKIRSKMFVARCELESGNAPIGHFLK